ncbi:hypothetical protein C2U43_19825 [Citrobacter freundii complex sp. CFNIH9]|nr:hypothetical protein C2U43_19825 [Citrobacter freundii complex sp. CFNIH9]
MFCRGKARLNPRIKTGNCRPDKAQALPSGNVVMPGGATLTGPTGKVQEATSITITRFKDGASVTIT